MEDTRNSVFSIYNKEPNASYRFLVNSQRTFENLTEKQHVELISFIIGWCNIYDVKNIEVISNNFMYILPPGSTKHIFLSFLSLFLEIIYISPETFEPVLAEFSEYICKHFGDSFLPTLGFTFFINIFEIPIFYPNIIAFNIKLIGSIIKVLDTLSVDLYLEKYYSFLSNESIIIKLSIIDTFSLIQTYMANEKAVLNKILNRFLLDLNPTVRIHSLFLASKNVNLIDDLDHILKVADDKSWKIRMTFLNILPNFASIPSFQKKLFDICKSSDLFFRIKAIDVLAKLVNEIDFSNQFSEIKKIAELSIRVKNDDVILATLKLLAVSEKTNEIDIFHENILNLFKKSKSVKVKSEALKILLMKFDVKESEENSFFIFITSLLKSENLNEVSDGIRIVGLMLAHKYGLDRNKDLIHHYFLDLYYSPCHFIKEEIKAIIPIIEETYDQHFF